MVITWLAGLAVWRTSVFECQPFAPGRSPSDKWRSRADNLENYLFSVSTIQRTDMTFDRSLLPSLAVCGSSVPDVR